METHLKKAIQLSITGGWKGPAQDDPVDIDMVLHELGPVVFLDSLFWQALGKMMRWGENIPNDGQYQWELAWKTYQHRFIDHLADGKDINSFFEKLLPPAPTG